MVNFTVDQIRALMDVPTNIRNMSVIAHVDHGKSTLSDSLIAAAGIIAKAKAGDTRFMQTRADEQARTITIKCSSVSLFFEMPKDELHQKIHNEKEDYAKVLKTAPTTTVTATSDSKDEEPKSPKKDEEPKSPKSPKVEPKSPKEEPKSPKKEETTEDNKSSDVDVKVKRENLVEEVVSVDSLVKNKNNVPFLINLIDSPGHVDFSSEVTAALRVTDGALVVVDCVEGVCVQTETVLRQAIQERIKPVLFVNKVDRLFLEMMMDLEEAYQSFARAIESVNVVIETYKDELLGDISVTPEKGTVGFGSGFQAWGFSVERFAKMYASRFGTNKETLMGKLWGDNFYDAKRKKWVKKAGEDKLPRAFVQFILQPISQVFTTIMEGKQDKIDALVQKLGVNIPKDEAELKGKPFVKTVMRHWLPASECLLQMIVNHLPSPVIAQKYRVHNLYSGPMDDEAATAIRQCNVNGPLMLYVSKMFPTSEKGRFYAFGRIFSGKVATGQEVRIQGPDYVPGKKNDLFVKKIQRCVLLMGRFIEQLQDCPCGNIIGLVGVDQYLLKSGTVTTHPKAHNFVTMKYSVSPVVRVAVQCTNAADLPKLIEGLKRLAKSDPLVQCITAPTGEHIVAGAGELHLEICLKDLREDFMKGAPITVGQPVVSFCETVKAVSDIQIISKSPNKHNRFYMRAEPLEDDLCRALEAGDIKPDEEMKVRARKLADDFKWDVNAARKIWSFGQNPDGIANVVVDATKGVAYLHEVKDSVVGAFLQVSTAGILCEEAMRGIRFNIEDVVLHADTIHRGAGQIMPAFKRAAYACQIRSEPSLYEPLYVCDITVPKNHVSGVYNTLNARRGQVETDVEVSGTPLTKIKAYLPVLESFGFTQLLRQNTSGQAFPQMIFSHWQHMDGEVYKTNTMANKTVLAVRKRKGLKEDLPDFNDYYDRI